MKIRLACLVLLVNCLWGCGPAETVIPTGQLTDEQKAAVKAEDDAIAMDESQGSIKKTKKK